MPSVGVGTGPLLPIAEPVTRIGVGVGVQLGCRRKADAGPDPQTSQSIAYSAAMIR